MRQALRGADGRAKILEQPRAPMTTGNDKRGGATVCDWSFAISVIVAVGNETAQQERGIEQSAL